MKAEVIPLAQLPQYPFHCCRGTLWDLISRIVKMIYHYYRDNDLYYPVENEYVRISASVDSTWGQLSQ